MNQEIRFLGIFRKSPAFHFYLMQFVGFAYFLYRFLSRDYTVYGLLDDDVFNYSRNFVMELYPLPALHFTSFQFIYTVIPRPTPEIIFILQLTVIVACIFGILGLFPKWSAIISFSIGLHITGLMQSSNSEIDGGTLALCLMLILSLAPAKNFYGFRNGFSILRRDVDYHWPVFLLFLTVGSFYTVAGINKLVDIGLNWPFELHLERLAMSRIEDSLFLSSRFVNPYITSLHLSYPMSVVAGFGTLIGELGFISILFIPRYRLFFILVMITMHTAVFLIYGINFMGNSFIILLCLDYNVLVRNSTVYYDDKCLFCVKIMYQVKKLDWFKKISLIPISNLDQSSTNLSITKLKNEIGLEDENGEVYYGADVFEQIASRCPILYPLAIIMKIPGIIYLSRYIYKIVSKNRFKFGCAG